MTKFSFFLFVLFFVTMAAFIAFLFLDDRGEEPAGEPEARTEQVEATDVRQP